MQDDIAGRRPIFDLQPSAGKTRQNLLGGSGLRFFRLFCAFEPVRIARVHPRSVKRTILPVCKGETSLAEISLSRLSSDGSKPIPSMREGCDTLQVRTIGGGLGRVLLRGCARSRGYEHACASK